MDKDFASTVWDTTALYPSPASTELEHDFAAAAEEVEKFRRSYLGKTTELVAAGLMQALVTYETLQERIGKPQMYAHLLFAADSEDDTNKALSQRAAEFGEPHGQTTPFLRTGNNGHPRRSIRPIKRR